MNDYLDGTSPFPMTETLWNHTFKDRYAKQWEATLQWMSDALRRTAEGRDEERGDSADWRNALRQKLRELSGIGLFESGAGDVRLVQADGGAMLYRIGLANGLALTGSLYVPDCVQPAGIVLQVDPSANGDGGAAVGDADEAAKRYTERGFIVIRPFAAREAFSYKEHEQRRWYKYVDHELIQFFAFICGGSLAGLEAAGWHAAVSRIGEALELDMSGTPVIVDARGRHLLSAAVMSAVYPGTVAALRLDKQAERLNRQESDERSNTIWGFHRHFDALTLFQLAEGTDLLFVENGATASALAAQTIHWFGQQVVVDGAALRTVVRVRDTDGEAAIERLAAARRTPEAKSGPLQHTVRALLDAESGEPQQSSVDADLFYRDYLDSVHDRLKQLQDEAAEHKRQRFDIRSCGEQAYKERIRESIRTVMGDPLPRASGLNVRTRRVTDNQNGHMNLNAYDAYEVLLESVEGIDTAGYILIPKGSGKYPAVVCQHGLLGRPEDVIGSTPHKRAYYQIAHSLAEKGYVTFVPFMNWGWGGMPRRDRLAKHAYALGITPNRFEVAQLAGIVDFLQSRREVKPDRIGFYGLSYGGHASVWLCANEPRLAAVITSGHFNEWNKKLTCTEAIPPHKAPSSYICVLEGMDMFTYNALSHFGHAPMATLNAPRPYMVENGIWDGVAPVPWVNEEFAKIADVFDYLGAGSSAELNHFDGGHRMWGEESLLFLRKHLK
ncbi:MAG: Alpha/beta hydrolase family protein [Paenibacillus sp.]|nr:Alpha/beta hydrolase family protein [Paenibacillus sp.]